MFLKFPQSLTTKNPQGDCEACKMLKCHLSDKRQRKFFLVECWCSAYLVFQCSETRSFCSGDLHQFYLADTCTNENYCPISWAGCLLFWKFYNYWFNYLNRYRALHIIYLSMCESDNLYLSRNWSISSKLLNLWA